LVFHYLDDLDSKLAAARVALATPSGDDEWSSYSGALGRRFLRLEQFLNPQSAAQAPELQPASTLPIESAQTKPTPKPKSEQGFLRKLFS
jgi:hypothetical protein